MIAEAFYLGVLCAGCVAALAVLLVTDVAGWEPNAAARNVREARPHGAVMATEIRLRLRAEGRSAQRVPPRLLDDVWPLTLDHSEPERELTVPHAHREMQRHRGCLRECCHRKAAAWRVLVEAGHIQPDAGRTR